jgi:hypothetical protein
MCVLQLFQLHSFSLFFLKCHFHVDEKIIIIICEFLFWDKRYLNFVIARLEEY